MALREVFEDVKEGGSRYRGTVGLVYGGAMQSVHWSFFEMVPPDVNVLIYTKLWSKHMLHDGDFDADAFATQRVGVIEAAHEAADFVELDSLCIGGDLVQAAMGREWCENVRDEIEGRIGVPTFMAMELVCESLRHLGAQQIALVSPFPKKRSDHLVGYLESAGFDVPLVRGVNTTTNATIRDLPYSLPHDLVARALEDGPDVEAVYLTCPVWHSNEAIDALEERFDMPVVTMFTPILWKGLEAIGWDGTVDGYGRLLAA